MSLSDRLLVSPSRELSRVPPTAADRPIPGTKLLRKRKLSAFFNRLRSYPAFDMDPAALEEWQKDPNWQSDEEVACHEAGHAFVAHALGGRIEDMTIEPIEYPRVFSEA